MVKMSGNVISFIAAAILASTTAVEGWGSDTFTYQGRLKEAGQPITGDVDLRFTLLNGAAAPVAAPVTLAAVPVNEGLFTVDLDFGSGLFDGSARLLGIEVASPAGSGVFAPLLPHQPVHAAPYALHAYTAGSLPAVYANPVSFTNASNQFSGSGTGLSGLNATGIATGNLNAARMPTGGNWALSSDLNIDNNTFVVRAATDSVAIGVATPAQKLHLQGDGADAFALFGDFATGVPYIHFRSTDSGHDWILRHANSSFYLQSELSSGNEVMTWQSSGNVGIGTTAPAARLDVTTPTGYGIRGHAVQTSGATIGVIGIVDSSFGTGVYGEATSGIGTGISGRAQGAGGRGVSGWASATTGTGIGIYGEVGSDSGWAGYFNGRGYFSSNVGVGTSSPSARLHAESSSGITFAAHSTATSGIHYGVFSDVDASTSYAGYFLGGRSYFSGNVGIGTTVPAVKLHVSGGSDANFGSGSGYAVFGSTSAQNIVMDDNEIIARNNGSTAVLHLNAEGGNVQIGAFSGGTSRIITPIIEITGGSDLSEQFDVVAENGAVEAGMVVCIDPAEPGRLRVSSSAYNRTVAGVISGAGGVQTGMLMGQRESIADGGHAVALTGRVYVLCDTTDAAIEPGDLLTTSSTSGHAMKAADESRCHGAIIGKAMTELEKGKRGLVLVLVSLH